MSLPQIPIVGSYGGGDAMMTARQILNLSLGTKKVIPDSILRINLNEMVMRCLIEQEKIPAEKRVAHLPPSDSMKNRPLTKFSLSCHFQISSQVYGEFCYNFMLQGLLFSSIPKQQPKRLGAVSYPLIGVFEADGIFPTDPLEVGEIGFDNLNWAGQHVCWHNSL
jgi:hypothetical protein